MADKVTCKVKWFNDSKGFGFVEQEGGEDAFVHYSQINSDDDRRALNDGDTVTCFITDGPKGLQAEDVTVMKTAEAV